MSSRKDVVITSAAFAPQRAAQIRNRFYHEGFVVIPQIFSAEEVQTLKRACDRVFEEPKWRQTHNVYGEYIAVRMFEVDRVFEELVTREPIISLVESILGPTCHLVANNVVRNRPGEAIDFFHVDDLLFFPVGEGMVRHDPRLTMPVYILTVQILLTDVPAIEFGATEYVPGSHYAGQIPADKTNPTFEGREPVPVLGKAGDIYLHNGQCWHRGAPNRSDRTRYLLQLTYGMRWVSQRFYPFVNYQFPPGIVERADDRQKRVLGFHPKGPYG